MRILHVNNMNQVAKAYGSDLARRGHTVAIYEPDTTGSGAALPVKLALMPKRVLNLRHVVSRLNPDYFDLVHIHWASYGILGLVSKIPFVVHCRGDDVRKRLNSPLFQPLLTTILRRAAAVLCVTPDLLPLVKEVRPDALFFPAPLDSDQFTLEKCDHYEPSRPWTILLFSRLAPDKGSDIALRGIAQFVQRHCHVRVQLLDWGSLAKTYKQQYKHFEFLPLVPQHEVVHMLRPVDVVVGQFSVGALGLAELQAMSCSKPVIASFRYEDAYPAPASIYQAATAEQIDERLEYLFFHPEEAKVMGQKAREWVIRYHDYRTLSSELEMLYESIIANKSEGM